MFWAGVGAAFVVLIVYMLVRWMFLSGDFKSVPVGPTEVPFHMAAAARVNEVLGMALLICCIYRFIVRPMRRDGRMGWDGMLLVSAMSLWVVGDALCNYTGYVFLYNAVATNWGSWYPFFPGWNAPNAGSMSEPPFFGGSWYAWGMCLAVILFSGLMRKLKERWPTMSTARLLGIVFVTIFVADLVMELIYVRLTGLYVFTSPIKGLTLWYGKYYQFPLYESVFVALAWTGFSFVRFSRDDKGHSLLERGIDRVGTGRRSAMVVRQLALIGGFSAMFVLLFSVPHWFMNLHSKNGWPEDIVKRSYYTQGICGEGTDWACPTKGSPLMRRGDIHLRPDGTLSVPPGTEIPRTTVPFMR